MLLGSCTPTHSLPMTDVFHSGIVITTISALIALLTLIYILLLLLSHRMTKFTRLSNQLLPFEWMSLAFCAVWLFATQVPFTHFFATRSAQVTAFTGNIQVPPGLVQIVENQLGFTTVYRRIHYRTSSRSFVIPENSICRF